MGQTYMNVPAAKAKRCNLYTYTIPGSILMMDDKLEGEPYNAALKGNVDGRNGKSMTISEKKNE